MPVDQRFFEQTGAVTLGEIADRTGAELRGDRNQTIDGIAPSASAGRRDVCFFEGKPGDLKSISAEAGACFIRSDFADGLPDGVAALVSRAPRLAHARLSETLFRHRPFSDCQGVDPQAAIHAEARLGAGVSVGPGAAIGAGSHIGPGTAIGPGVQIGRNCQIGANVSIQCALIGDQVKIASGARIGEAGFGVIAGPSGPEDQPHFGRVIIQDHVTIGANSTVDRGAFDDTILGERSKIDNLCHVAHNVVLGRGVIMAGFTGIAGSSVLGDGVRLGARAGIADHVTVGRGATLAAGGGSFRDIPEGETWGGTPAKPIREYMREVAWLSKQSRIRKKDS